MGEFRVPRGLFSRYFIEIQLLWHGFCTLYSELKNFIIMAKHYRSVESLMRARFMGKITNEEYEKEMNYLSNLMTNLV